MNTALPKEIRCLAFPSEENDGTWSAVALELDVWGFGDTKEEAMSDLDKLIEGQIEFTFSTEGGLEILDHPTNEKWFRLWDLIEDLKIVNSITQGSSTVLQDGVMREKHLNIKNSDAENHFYQVA